MPARSTAPSTRCSARSCCAPARIRFSRRARGPACSIRSSAARRPARRRSISPAIAELVREANEFLSGRSRLVQKELATEMDTASAALDFERAAIYRDRLAALSAITSHQGINPRTLEEADVFAVHQAGGYTCVEVFFFRTGQNWGNRAYFPKADRALGAGEVLSAFLAQFYDDKPPPRLVLASHDFEERALLAAALSTKSGRKVEVARAATRRAQGAGAACAGQCARGAGAQARRHVVAAETAEGADRDLRAAARAAPHRGLRQQPYRRHQCGRRHGGGGAGRLPQEPVPQVQHPLAGPQARRRLRHAARGVAAAVQEAAGGEPAADGRCRARRRAHRRAGRGRRTTLARSGADRRRAGPTQRGGRNARRDWA